MHSLKAILDPLTLSFKAARKRLKRAWNLHGVAPSMLAAAAAPQTPATETHDDYVRASKDGEFLSAYYPEGALKRGEEGTVWFKIGIEKEGWIRSCEITQSSGFQALDRETCEITRAVQYAKVSPVRSSDGRIVRAIQDGRITW